MPTLMYMNEARTQELIDQIKTRLATKQNIMQYATMPTPSAANLGETYQYIGADTEDYKAGASYKVVYDAENTTYKYEQVAYSKGEVDAAIAIAGHFVVVDELPTTDIQTNVIYLVPKMKEVSGYVDSSTDDFYYPTGTEAAPAYALFDEDGFFVEDVTGSDAEAVKDAIDAGTYTEATRVCEIGQVNNVKDEYINLDGTTAGWEKIGDTELDLSNYVQFDNLVPITQEELVDMWKSAGTITVDSATVSVAAGSTETVNVTAHSGTVSVESDDTAVATVSISGDVITIEGQAAGTANITVTSAATTDYKAATTTIEVTVA